ncbi:unnamed protein product, partial [Medioppia subpectinata]
MKVKVFKSKGADRKHKTDRERLARQPDSTLYYQPSYDCTLFTIFNEDDVYIPTSSSPTTTDTEQHQQHQVSSYTGGTGAGGCGGGAVSTSLCNDSSSQSSTLQHNMATSSSIITTASSSSGYLSSHPSDDSLPSLVTSGVKTALPSDATPTETYEWLNRNRFHRLTDVLMNFSAEDLRRLSRDDL